MIGAPMIQGLLERAVCVEVPPARSLTRQQLMDQIMTLNPSATVGYLATFSDQALDRYFEHLQRTTEPRGGTSRWVRPNDSRAIVSRSARS